MSGAGTRSSIGLRSHDHSEHVQVHQLFMAGRFRHLVTGATLAQQK